MNVLPATLMAVCSSLLLAFPHSLAAADESAADLCKDVQAAYKAKETLTAVGLFDRMVQQFPGFPPADQALVVKTVAGAFESRRDEGDAVDQLFIGAGASLANMGPNGEKALVKALDLKHLKARPIVFATLVEGLGQQINVAMVPKLLLWLKPEKPLGPNAPIVGGAARALVRYREAEPAVRKQAVGELVAVYADLSARFDAERAKAKPDPVAQGAFQELELPLLQALRALSGEQFENSADWSRWWPTAKDADWTATEPASDRPSRLPGLPGKKQKDLP